MSTLARRAPTPTRVTLVHPEVLQGCVLWGGGGGGRGNWIIFFCMEARCTLVVELWLTLAYTVV